MERGIKGTTFDDLLSLSNIKVSQLTQFSINHLPRQGFGVDLFRLQIHHSRGKEYMPYVFISVKTNTFVILGPGRNTSFHISVITI